MTNFIKQGEQPLFPEIFWNRPTMRSRGGRLLIVGGHKQEFSQLQAIYQIAQAAGIGECKAAMPDSLRRLLGESEFGWFLPASQSGSLGRAALGELTHIAADFDAVLIGGNLTNNAETAIMIESLVGEINAKLIFTEEAFGILKFKPDLITGNPNALVVTTMNGLFELANHHHMPIAIKPNSGVIGKMEIIDQLVSISRCSYLVFDGEAYVASEGDLSLTALKTELHDFAAVVAGAAATFWLQHPAKPFAALTTAAFVLSQLEGKSITEYERQLRQTIQKYDQ